MLCRSNVSLKNATIEMRFGKDADRIVDIVFQQFPKYNLNAIDDQINAFGTNATPKETPVGIEGPSTLPWSSGLMKVRSHPVGFWCPVVGEVAKSSSWRGRGLR
jgi:hypothetical protein